MTEFTPGPWKWWTSNSWRRLMHDDPLVMVTQNVIQPYVQRDQHPDLMVSEADMGLIAAAPDLYEALERASAHFHQASELSRQIEAALTKARTPVSR